MEIFKYTRQKYKQAALERGSIRLGTLFDYRKTESHGIQIGDEREGRITLEGTLENLTHEHTEGHSALERLVKLGPGATIGKLVVSNLRLESENLFVFSTSSAFSELALLEWNKDPHARYDSCYQINSARLFFKAISQAISDRATFLGFGSVHYYDSSAPIQLASPLARLHPGQLKGGITHGHQIEIRAFWRPIEPTAIEPMSIEIPELRKYVANKFTLASSSSQEA